MYKPKSEKRRTKKDWNVGVAVTQAGALRLVEAATAPETPQPEGERVGRFRVIDGGLS